MNARDWGFDLILIDFDFFPLINCACDFNFETVSLSFVLIFSLEFKFKQMRVDPWDQLLGDPASSLRSELIAKHRI